MCGITGWIDWQRDLKNEESVLRDMTQTLIPRGPDAQGFWFSKNAAFGHRRLIVVDPEGGLQPMERKLQDKSFIITYNGELYNTPQLRDALLARGHHFHSYSDTEVLLVSYMEWGEDCVKHLNGIYAFAIWDEAKQCLFAARDRVGVKPFFYSHQQDSFIFGSELKTLLAHPMVKPRVDREGLAEVLVMGPSRTPGHGVFRDISELKPGYSLVFSQRGLKVAPYWQLESQPHEDDLETTTAKVRQLFIEGVTRQLVADVPVCTLLSGGLDSSAITALASNYFKEAGYDRITTYSVDFKDNDQYFVPSKFQPNSDVPWIKTMTEFLNTEHKYINFDTPDQIQALRQAVLARDLPGMADVDSSLLLFCGEIKKDATVALSGECADEIFGGYPWFVRAAENEEFANFPWMTMVNERAGLLNPEVTEAIKPQEYALRRYHEALAEVPRLTSDSPLEARVREMFYLNITRFMPTLLDRKDRMSMAVGLEVRVPFCDHHLLDYVWNIPWNMKRYDDREKGILRRALVGLLPDDVLWRKKSPYPKTHNPSYMAGTKKLMSDLLQDGTSPIFQLIDKKAIASIMNSEVHSFNTPWFGQLMGEPQLYAYLYQLDIWMREYKVEVIG